MKSFALALIMVVSGLTVSAQTSKQKAVKSTVIENQVVEIACGECKFKMKGKSCDLAVRIDGKPYFVDGKSIDDFGDAHDEKHGFCNVIAKATASGEIVNNRFKAKNITLIDIKK